STRQAAEDLVDRDRVGEEAVAGGAQVEAPDAEALGASQLAGARQVGLEALDPVAQGLGVVGAELLDLAGGEARPFERQENAREVERLTVGEDVALGEGP